MTKTFAEEEFFKAGNFSCSKNALSLFSVWERFETFCYCIFLKEAQRCCILYVYFNVSLLHKSLNCAVCALLTCDKCPYGFNWFCVCVCVYMQMTNMYERGEREKGPAGECVMTGGGVQEGGGVGDCLVGGNFADGPTERGRGINTI